MLIELKKFGTTLVSRQAGKEAYLAFASALEEIPSGEKAEIDFEGVVVFIPSWGDEFITPIWEKFGERLILKNTENSSVQATLELLEKISGKKFIVGKK